MEKRRRKIKPQKPSPQTWDDYDEKDKIDSPLKLIKFIDWVFELAETLRIDAKNEVFWRKFYKKASIHAVELQQTNPEFTGLPKPTSDNRENLIQLRAWCVGLRWHNQQGTTSKDIVIIDASKFSNGKTWQLLKAIVGDERRKGVECKNPRTLKSLKERFKNAGNNLSNDSYVRLAKSLKYKDGLAWTTIPFGKIQISPKKITRQKTRHFPNTTPK
jgi:hypothetical protein